VQLCDQCTADGNVDSGTRHVSFYVSLGGGGLTSLRTIIREHRLVLGYTYVHANTIHVIYIGAFVYKSHRTGNYKLVEVCISVQDVDRHTVGGVGWGPIRGRRGTGSDSDCQESMSVRRVRDPTIR
jgi:hypothetical protein